MIREYIVKISDEVMEEEIADRPQELIRCNGCKYLNTPANGVPFCKRIKKFVDADWFCADGERKGETEIIRCKDCKHFVVKNQSCKYHGMYISLKPDNYCERGERQ